MDERADGNMEKKGSEQATEPESASLWSPGTQSGKGREPKTVRGREWMWKISGRLSLVPRGRTGVAPGTDLPTVLAQDRTDLALVRSFMAAERTLMAWIRTSLSMISFGFGIAKIVQTLESPTFELSWVRRHLIGADSIGYTLVLLGTGSLVMAILQHYATMRELRAMGLEHGYCLTRMVAIVLSLLGVFAFSSLVLKI
jgi:putative membrane protein